MKKFAIFFLSVLLFDQYSSANMDPLYTCTPIKPTDLVRRVILSNNNGGGKFALTVVKVDAEGRENVLNGEAKYYDDMTYLGYHSEKLSAYLEFDYPEEWQEAVRFYMGETLIYMACQESLRSVQRSFK